ncbi:hypothetical protein C1Y63_11880 [Corynebacterium sp. 13CS0277]|uniref:single-stranded DNA-binding protein n=1 Tax=Corynebacterium sp. 13CS0277 TaxID=2071994 RepID=UPI000D03585C|nr:single-stranded DNA-binding protein [Corynebacterium sp. 13CS0277]PRQ10358.1 hypothetical protein C1Y63_11880 [Corynebacterium sp. 13CS0277]
MALHTFTAVGMVCSDPHYKQTAPGQGVVTFRLKASNATRGQDGQWTEQDALWLTVEAWGVLAENVRRSIAKLMQVIVVGTLVTREYVNSQGDNRQNFVLKAQAIGPDLRRLLVVDAVSHMSRDVQGADRYADIGPDGLHTWIDSSLVDPRYNARAAAPDPSARPGAPHYPATRGGHAAALPALPGAGGHAHYPQPGVRAAEVAAPAAAGDFAPGAPG